MRLRPNEKREIETERKAKDVRGKKRQTSICVWRSHRFAANENCFINIELCS